MTNDPQKVREALARFAPGTKFPVKDMNHRQFTMLDEADFMAVEVIARALHHLLNVEEKAHLKRNVVIGNDDRFDGVWVAVPKEDFDALSAALNGENSKANGGSNG